MPTNDTGSSLIVGPDVDGNVFEVGPGEDYTLPQPPSTVADEEAQAQAEEPAPSVPDAPSGSAKPQTPAPADPPPAPAAPPTPPKDAPPAPVSTEGASA